MADAPGEDNKEKTYDIGVWLGYLHEKVAKEIFNMELRTGLLYELNNLEDSRKLIENGLKAGKNEDVALATLNKEIQRVEDNIEKAKSLQYIQFAFMESEQPSALDARYKLELEEVVKSMYNVDVIESAETLLQQIIDEVNFESNVEIKQKKVAEAIILLNTLMAYSEVEARKGHFEKLISLLQSYVSQIKNLDSTLPQEAAEKPEAKDQKVLAQEPPASEKKLEEKEAPHIPSPVGEQATEAKTEDTVVYPLSISGKTVQVSLPKETADKISDLFKEQATLQKTLEAIESDEEKKKTKSELTKLKIEIYKLIKPYLPKE